MKLLITGKPGVGKTTLIKKLVHLVGEPVAGFLTEDVREGGVRKGFRIAAIDGKQGLLSHVDFRSRFKVGKYGVNVEEFESIALPEIDKSLETASLLIIDEIAKMELFSERFRKKLIVALDSGRDIIATIQDKPIPLLNELRSREDIELMVVTESNRDSLPEVIAERLKKR